MAGVATAAPRPEPGRAEDQRESAEMALAKNACAIPELLIAVQAIRKRLMEAKELAAAKADDHAAREPRPATPSGRRSLPLSAGRRDSLGSAGLHTSTAASPGLDTTSKQAAAAVAAAKAAKGCSAKMKRRSVLAAVQSESIVAGIRLLHGKGEAAAQEHRPVELGILQRALKCKCCPEGKAAHAQLPDTSLAYVLLDGHGENIVVNEWFKDFVKCHEGLVSSAAAATAASLASTRKRARSSSDAGVSGEPSASQQ
eukprot:gene12653-14957_t